MSATRSSPCRLAHGGEIDRNQPLNFTFNGEAFVGFKGDTLASALLAAGVLLFGRSIRRRRPRGVLATGAVDPNSLVTIGEGGTQDPVALATQVALHEGLAVRSVRGWPNLRWDLGAALDLPFIRHLTAAGFYYKTFFWPRWEWFEPLIREAAGPAAISPVAPIDEAEHEFASAEAIVIGAGAAGIAAALELAATVRSVILLEEQALVGGSLRWSGECIQELSGPEWIAHQTRILEQNPRITLLRNTRAFGCYDHGTVGALELMPTKSGPQRRFRLWRLRAPQIVLATGALERPLLFADNDRPGIFLASAALEYLGRFGVQVARRPVLATNNDAAYGVAAALAAHCWEPVVILDSRVGWSAAAAALPSNVEVLTGATVAAALAGRAIKDRSHRHGAVTAVQFSHRNRVHTRACDALIVSGGWSPAIQLASHTSIRPFFDRSLAILKTPRVTQEFYAVGAASGQWGQEAAIVGARESVRACNGQAEVFTSPRRNCWPVAADCPQPAKNIEANIWVDLQNDVTLRDLRIACDHGLQSIEHIKRFTTLGMGTDQGRTSAANAMQAVGALLGRSAEEVGVTSHRPPLAPTSLAALAAAGRGALFAPRRLLPAIAPQLQLKARLEDFGGWQRPDFYAVNGHDREAAVTRECLAVRQGVGLFDGSSIGKIEVSGPDAASFLDRFYINNMMSLSAGRVRYGVMLNDHGVILDDGVVARRGPDHFIVSPTSSNARRVYAWLERWRQLEWPEKRVVVIDVTEQWAVLTLAGPQAGAVFRSLALCPTLRTADLKHMSFSEGFIDKVCCRVWRVSYTGEAQFEIQVPSDQAESVWMRIWNAGAQFDVRPIGLEAWTRLRIDKGYLHMGTDTDGRTAPDDVGYGDIARAKVRPFIGQRSLNRADSRRANRLQLVGLLSDEPQYVIPEGSHILGGTETSVRICRGRAAVSAGHVTSSCMSVALGRSIALALLEGGRARSGNWVSAFHLGTRSRAQVVSPVFYDPQGRRLHG